MKKKDRLVEMTLHGGPLNGDTFEIMESTLLIRPFVSFDDGNGGYHEYKYTFNDKFEYVTDENRNDPAFRATGGVFTDDGDLIAEVDSMDEAVDILDLLDKAEDIKDKEG